LLVFGLYCIEGVYSQNQTFSSGSTGAEGALNITAPGVTYFNPTALNLHPANANVFNFTTITIAQGATLKLTEEVFHGPANFLASGAVVISGTLDLSGDSGVAPANQSARVPTYAGSGGYGGGLSGGPNGLPAPGAGSGPEGGAASTPSTNAGGGQFTGNYYLIPLIGGSGGGGITCGNGGFGASGGAGGGAILIASSSSITVNGVITAQGGIGPTPCEAQCVGGFCVVPPYAGGGGGGAIRLMAPVVAGTGNINAGGGGGNSSGGSPGSAGRIRVEAFQQNFNGGISGPLAQSIPYAVALPATPAGSLTVTSVNGMMINANPFNFPDAIINASGPVSVSIQGQYIPPGTVPKLTVFSDSGLDQVITCSPLQGTLQLSTSTATVTFPPNAGSRGLVKATWTQ
jgi:hypothetical protein